jgi:hypothetical protein
MRPIVAARTVPIPAKAALSRLALILAGCGFAFVMATIGLMLFPGAVFGATDYYERRYAGQSLNVSFRHSDGDLFVALPGSIRPPQENAVLESFTIIWDSDGFRRPAQQAEAYPIALFGDSFTEGFNVPVPYADRLAQFAQMPVRNYGYRAYGPVEVARAAKAFAALEARDWVIYGYFSGNDLGDAVRPPKIDTRSPFALWTALFARLNPPLTDPYQLPVKDHYDFPLPVIIGGSYYEMAFLWYYWWWQLAPEEGFAASQNFTVLSDSLDEIAAASPSGACKALVYIPTKEHLYYRYIYPTDRQWVRNAGHKLVLDSDKTIKIVPAPIAEGDEAQFMAALYGQRDAVRALVEGKPGWRFIDLLPAFESAVAGGQLIYYPYDSHWNQAGHDLAAQTIAAALEDDANGCEGR